MVIAKVPTSPNRKPSARCNYPRVPRVAATFDDVNLLPSAGLVPVMRLARRAGLGIVGEKDRDGARWGGSQRRREGGLDRGRDADRRGQHRRTWTRCGRARWARCCPG